MTQTIAAGRVAPRVAVIVVNWKVRELLRGCLQSVYDRGGWPAGEFEVIVVDNDSRDGSVEMVAQSFPQVRLIANPANVGFGAANNQALEATRAERIVLLNPDTVVLDGALAKMVEALEAAPDVAIVGCRLLNADGSLQRWTAGSFPTLKNVASHYLFGDRVLPRRLCPPPLYLDRDVREPIDVDWVSGACMAIRREALQGLLFDQRFFMYAEDMELCHRLHRGGWRVVYDPRMSIVHYQGASIQQQKAEIMISSLKGPRDYFEQIHGRRAAKVVDWLALVGFGLRWGVNAAAWTFGRNDAARKRADSSWQYLRLAAKIVGQARH